MQDLTIPNQKAVEKTIKSVFELLFPTTHSFTDNEIECNRIDLQNQILCILSGLTDKNEEVTQQFFSTITFTPVSKDDNRICSPGYRY